MLLSAARGGEIRGRLTDPIPAELRGALVRLLPEGSSTVLARVLSDAEGRFAFSGVRPGRYLIRATVGGFREQTVDPLAIQGDEVLDAGDIKLSLAGCYSPRVNCDFVTPDGASAGPTLHSSGDKHLAWGCVIDLDNGKLDCPEPGSEHHPFKRGPDLRLVSKQGAVFLEPLPGATISPLQPVESDCGGSKQSASPFRIDGLDPGNDWCIRTTQGRISRFFLAAEVEPGTTGIFIHFVTFK
ncbi:MAG: carboxypeptidase regulatory-like domain-containing protein [Acidobacteria bacterium]|nr:carboxypeptidase regulatory-like domain-containing protein [Acidobacteriota bacterium]